MEIRFYHLEHTALNHALPQILQKAYDADKRCLVKVANDSMAKDLSTALWTHNPNSFLPHGTAKDGQAEHQPIWITSRDENPNNAKTLFITDPSEDLNTLDGFDLCCVMFDGHNSDALTAARTKWKTLKDGGHFMTYWQQTPQGWQKKAEENNATTN